MSDRFAKVERYAKLRDGWLIDTNIVSATIGNKPLDPGIVHFFERIPDERLWLSVLTMGELRKGIELLSVDAKDLLESKLGELQSAWKDRILPVGLEVADKWGELTAWCQRRGSPVPPIDGLIAATACVHNLILVSHDKFFARMEERLVVYDPLSGEGQAR